LIATLHNFVVRGFYLLVAIKDRSQKAKLKNEQLVDKFVSVAAA
jgi:hypothetical protein